MITFKNLHTMTKLILCTGISTVCILAVGWMALNGQSVLTKRLESINNTNLAPIKVIGEMRTEVNRIRLALDQHLMTKDTQKLEDEVRQMGKNAAHIKELLVMYQPMISSEKEREAYGRFQAAYVHFTDLNEQVIKLSAEGKKEEAMAALISLEVPKAKEVAQALQDIAEDNSAQAEVNYKGAVSEGESLRSIMLGAIIISTLLGAGLGWIIARIIVQSLTNVGEVVAKLAGGDLAARSTVASKDEIGQLAQAFNQMGQQLQDKAQQVKDREQEVAVKTAEVRGLIDAIGKAQAVIEFNLDGTVLTANENFLQCLGYRLDEIKGQHHRIFCDSAYTNSPAYGAFWQKLNRGEFDAGVYLRIGKGGKEVWIQASYNPVFDVNGKPYKVVKFATDITGEKNRGAEFEGKLNAINKAQAAIEFNLDGTVLTANENFLQCLGYRLDEIKGQHHRIFCDSAYTNSPAYGAFWQKLNRGEFDAGVYLRIGKGGKALWIQASYNPILNANGKVYKVVKFATDITAQKQAAADMERLVGEAQGSLGALAQGDLTQVMTGTYAGDLAKVKLSLNAALENLTNTITAVREAVGAVSTGAEEITKGNEDLSQRTSEQASALEETSASMEEMTSTVKQNADNAKQANQLAVAARDTADKGGAVTKRAVDAMGEINKSSKKIADIITVIDEIAFQTNLLALNAAVEAARAGEHGRGFAVVAAEVRNLAQRSATAAKEIKGLINESIQRVNDGSELVDQSGKTLEEIVHSVKRVGDIIAEITAASQEQASGIEQVNKAIMSMDETTQQNAALVEETTSASQSMKEQAKGLMRQVEAFKVVQSHAYSGRPVMAQPEPVRLTGKVSAKLGQRKKAVGVGGGNDQEHHSSGEDFEEF